MASFRSCPRPPPDTLRSRNHGWTGLLPTTRLNLLLTLSFAIRLTVCRAVQRVLPPAGRVTIGGVRATGGIVRQAAAPHGRLVKFLNAPGRGTPLSGDQAVVLVTRWA